MASYSVPVSSRESCYQLRKSVGCQRDQSLATSFRGGQTIEMVQDRGSRVIGIIECRIQKERIQDFGEIGDGFFYCSHEIS